MNPNIIKKSPTKQFITPTYPFNLRSNKNGMHSSIQESTKSELSLKEHQNSVGSQQVTVPLNSGFNKVKKEENLISPALRTHHSEKTILYKPENWPELKKTTESPDKNGDYYGFKGTHKFLNPRQKVEQKLSDSGNSDFSQNSGNSNGKAQPKIAKFISKKKEIDLPMFKPDLFVSKVKPIILQQKSSQFHKFTPYDNSPHKKQDLTNPSTDNIAYKRSSLSPQNKLPLNRQISHETFGVFKTNFTPKKSTTPIKNIQKDITVQKDSQTQKLKKQKQFYRQEAQKKQQKNDFSFNKQHESPRKSRSIYLAPMISMLNFVHQAISFTQLEKLAENKSSCIYKCLHSSTNMVFCIKKSAVDNHNLDQLIVQHKVATYLDHPNLVRGFATFYDRSYLYLLMEYMEDRSLAVIMKDKLKFGNAPISPRMKNPQIFRMNPRETLKQKSRLSQMYSKTENQNQENLQRLCQIKAILQQILEGLFFLHENGIMHRDLKPDNIFVSNNNYKIGDFGSCSYTNSQQYYGTLDYAAPEIMLKQKYDKSIDLWSLGCVAYQLDTGSPPFYHYNRGETMRRIVNVEYNAELISDFHLKKFIAKLLVRTGRITAGEALMEVKMMEFGGHGVRPRPSWGQ